MANAVRKQREIEADWDRKAILSAIDASRAVIGEGINGRAMVSSLGDIEWTWICCAAIFAWIKTKSQQAVEEGTGFDVPIRTMKHRDPEPWEAGAVESILPALGELDLPWGSPLGEWPRDTITGFAWQISRLVQSSLAARDEGAVDKIVQRLSQPQIEREMSAANGGPLMSRAELNDEIPL